ncbi:MAG: glyoxalase/bleomycin resistance/dioxygenase family protein [Acidovorax sp.]|jgi:predicted enzyme related to lactoylglutathione lyase|nr:glyoxalase/bleomycin resistance/dioxygenase family protein [Acidovorax sp.]
MPESPLAPESAPISHPIAAVMVHVGDVQQALAWYLRAFDQACRHRPPGTDFECLRIAGVQLELVPADQKVGSGPAGSVVYWRVDCLARARSHFLALGATPYRGPLAIESGLGICQVRDPWGNCIGLRGPWKPGGEAGQF